MNRKRILVAGGMGYVGSRLVPRLMRDYDVNILDTGWFWEKPEEARNYLGSGTGRYPQIFLGDMREIALIRRAMMGCDAAILLGCVSNDPSAELNQGLCQAINQGATGKFIQAVQENKLERFIYASSSSIFGIQPDDLQVVEDVAPAPLTLYSKLKLGSEKIINQRTQQGMINSIIVRPATLCGLSPRQRLDLVVNIFVDQAVNGDRIRVMGGDNYRPNLGISRMVACYEWLLKGDLPSLVGQTFNVGGPNYKVRELAELVQSRVNALLGKKVDIEETKTDDNRSYRINSDKIQSFGFEIYDIVRDIDELILHLDLYNREKGGPNQPMMNLSKSKNIEVMKQLIAGGLT